MRLSENFTIDEFLRSDTATRAGRELDPPHSVVNNLTRLAQDVLQPIRNLLGKPVRITSGYRDEWLNKKVGGAVNSAHTTGRAADFYVPGMELLDVANIIADTNIGYDKLIYEGNWIHIQIAKPGQMPRRVEFTAVFTEDGVKYMSGIS